MALVDRVRNMIVNPEREWPVVAAERTDPAQLVAGYLVPLAVVSAVAGFIGSTLLAAVLPFGTFVGGFVSGIIGACISVLLVIVGCYIVALIINILAPYFGARPDYTQAFKTAVYGNTAGLAAGVAQIIPIIGSLVVLLASLYGLYVLYLGLPHTMQVPRDRTMVYFLAILAVCIVLAVVVSIVFTILGVGMAMLA
ncbi:MAG: Yip1 family protein [Vicinamibacterales bacterium]